MLQQLLRPAAALTPKCNIISTRRLLLLLLLLLSVPQQ
jgi:hypothetical protein